MEQNELNQRKRKALLLLVALADIRAATTACQLLIEHVRGKADPLNIPLQAAMIVSYARPFTKNQGYGALGAEWHKFEDKEIQEMHESLLDLRDKVIAHSDVDARRVEFKLETNNIGRRVSEVKVESDCLAIGSFQKVLKTCLDLGQRLEEEALSQMDCLSE